MIKIFKRYVLVFLLFYASGVLAATDGNFIDTKEQLAQADLVIVGSVRDIRYALSNNVHGVPHTYVTFDVERIVFGKYEQKQLTLRFMGGRSGESDFTHVEGVPLFDIGDRDILMVQNNTNAACPLVNCEDGRYRLINDNVFTDSGRALERNAMGALYKAEYYELPEVMTHKVSMTTISIVDQLGDGESRRDPLMVGKGAYVRAKELLQQMQQEGRSLNREAFVSVKNADPTQKFEIGLKAVAPPAPMIETPRSDRSDATAQDIAERAAVMRNGGNPVLNVHDEFKELTLNNTKSQEK